jgi:hypothetical protein
MEDLRKIVDYTTIFDNLEEYQRFLKEKQGVTTFLVIRFPRDVVCQQVATKKKRLN